MVMEPPQEKNLQLGKIPRLASFARNDKTWGRCTFCHSDRSVSGVEESTTLDEEPTQDKICHLGRFLDSFHSLGMTWSVGGSVMSARVVFGTWRAADCRPYIRSTSAPIVPTMRNVVLRLIHRLRRSPFPEGEGFAWCHSSARVVFVTSPERHTGRSLQ